MKQNLEDDSSKSRSPSLMHVGTMAMGNRNETHTVGGGTNLPLVTTVDKIETFPVMSPRDCSSNGNEDPHDGRCSMFDAGNQSNDQHHDWNGSTASPRPLHVNDHLQLHTMKHENDVPLTSKTSTSSSVRPLPEDCFKKKMSLLPTACSAGQKRKIDVAVVNPQQNKAVPQSPIKKKKTISILRADTANNDNDSDYYSKTDEVNNINSASSSAGRWTPIEHQAFLLGMAVHGREWKKVAEKIPSRTSAQVRSHAQKYFSKVERQQQVNSSHNTSSHLPDGPISSSYSDNNYHQHDNDLPLSTAVFSHGSGMCTPYTVTGIVDTQKRIESSLSSSQQQISNTRVLLSPPVQNLSESAQQEAARIVSSPATVEAEIQDTLHRLHERYRYLQEQLQHRQQLRQQQVLPIVQEAHAEAVMEHLVIIENEVHLSLDEAVVPSHPNEHHLRNCTRDVHMQSTNQDRPSANDRKEVEENRIYSLNSSNKSMNEPSLNEEGTKSQYGMPKRERTGSLDNSACCSMSTSTNNDSASSLLLLASSIVKVQAQDEIIALNVLRNGLYNHMMSLQIQQQQHDEEPTEHATIAANKMHITIELDETNCGECNTDDSILAVFSNEENWNNYTNDNISIPNNAIVEKGDDKDENSHTSTRDNEEEYSEL